MGTNEGQIKNVFGPTEIDFRKIFSHLLVFGAMENVGQPKIIFWLTIK